MRILIKKETIIEKSSDAYTQNIGINTKKSAMDKLDYKIYMNANDDWIHFVTNNENV